MIKNFADVSAELAEMLTEFAVIELTDQEVELVAGGGK